MYLSGANASENRSDKSKDLGTNMPKPPMKRLAGQVIATEISDVKITQFGVSRPAFHHTIEEKENNPERKMRMGERKTRTNFEQIEAGLPTADDVSVVQHFRRKIEDLRQAHNNKSDEPELT